METEQKISSQCNFLPAAGSSQAQKGMQSFYEKAIQRHTDGWDPWIYPAGVNSAGGILDLSDMSFFIYQFYRLGLYVPLLSFRFF